jgi:hypothetical protein
MVVLIMGSVSFYTQSMKDSGYICLVAHFLLHVEERDDSYFERELYSTMQPQRLHRINRSLFV